MVRWRRKSVLEEGRGRRPSIKVHTEHLDLELDDDKSGWRYKIVRVSHFYESYFQSKNAWVTKKSSKIIARSHCICLNFKKRFPKPVKSFTTWTTPTKISRVSVLHCKAKQSKQAMIWRGCVVFQRRGVGSVAQTNCWAWWRTRSRRTRWKWRRWRWWRRKPTSRMRSAPSTACCRTVVACRSSLMQSSSWRSNTTVRLTTTRSAT